MRLQRELVKGAACKGLGVQNKRSGMKTLSTTAIAETAHYSSMELFGTVTRDVAMYIIQRQRQRSR